MTKTVNELKAMLAEANETIVKAETDTPLFYSLVAAVSFAEAALEAVAKMSPESFEAAFVKWLWNRKRWIDSQTYYHIPDDAPDDFEGDWSPALDDEWDIVISWLSRFPEQAKELSWEAEDDSFLPL